jgi:error-prone DNA polymerase
MTAEVISYRGRSAIRDVGKALGLSLDLVDQMAKKLDWWHRGSLDDTHLSELGLDPTDRTVKMIIALSTELLGFPRHLSQHVGGLVMTRTPLCELVPIENASMPNRTVIEWDKDDIDTLGILKVDVLALGMLTCISKAFKLIDNSDEATERRSDEGNQGKEGETHGEGEDFSGFDCMAEGQRVGEGCLYGNSSDAREGTFRLDQSDEAGIGVRTIQHCRGSCATESWRLPEVSANGARLTGRIDDTGRDRVGTGTDALQPAIERLAGRRGSRPAGSDSQPRKQTEPLTHSSLRRSVAPSLRRSPLQLHTIPPEDPEVYEMISNADTIGVFQIESRAQMSMLPRLRPRNFYDLVIEVAIVRPGPIQGNMVHPYLRRRNNEEPVTYPSPALEQVLSKTLGVPLFQEQAMKVAMVGAGFTAEEADRLRRAMAAWRKTGAIETFRQKIVHGMLRNGYSQEFAEQCFTQIRGFGEYGFPESHAASFALLVYVSAWLKRYHPAAFCAALLNSQPMGFYAPAQIVRDAIDHGVTVLPPDVNFSDWDCTLEYRNETTTETTEDTEKSRIPRPKSLSIRAPSVAKPEWGKSGPSVRLGLRQIKGLRLAHAQHLVSARKTSSPYHSVGQLHALTHLPRHTMEKLAEGDAFASLGLSRRQALWQVLELDDDQLPLFEEGSSSEKCPMPNSPMPQEVPMTNAQTNESWSLVLAHSLDIGHCVIGHSVNPPEVPLPPMPLGQEVMTDYTTTGLSLKRHPVSLVREKLDELNIITSEQLCATPHGKWVRVAGLVLIRQRPGTASGIVFETLEDETGIVNLIVRPNIYDKYRPAARHAALLHAEGYVERQGEVIHVMTWRMFDLSHLLAGYHFHSRDFH